MAHYSKQWVLKSETIGSELESRVRDHGWALLRNSILGGKVRPVLPHFQWWSNNDLFMNRQNYLLLFTSFWLWMTYTYTYLCTYILVISPIIIITKTLCIFMSYITSADNCLVWVSTNSYGYGWIFKITG